MHVYDVFIFWQNKSTKDLLEEAKKIAKPGAEPMWKLQGKKSPRKEKGRKDSKKDKKAQGTQCLDEELKY